MAMLHIVNKSPFERNALASCLSLAQDDSSVLLIEDGVVAATKNERFSDLLSAAMKRNISFYALSPDFKARGIPAERAIDGVKLIGYEDFVDLVENHNTVQSWL